MKTCPNLEFPRSTLNISQKAEKQWVSLEVNMRHRLECKLSIWETTPENIGRGVEK